MRLLLDNLTILIIHIIVALMLYYFAFMIIMKKRIPVFIGILLVVLATVLVIIQSYLYHYKLYNTDKGLRGILFPKDDPDYDPIGGRPGGLTWI